MRFTKITFTRPAFIPGLCDGKSMLSEVDAEPTRDGLEFRHGAEVTAIPWAHVGSTTRSYQEFDGQRGISASETALRNAQMAAAAQSSANLQPPPPPKVKRK